MTNKECVEHLKKLKVGIVFMNTLISDEADKDKIDLEALDHAIKVLGEAEKDEQSTNDN